MNNSQLALLNQKLDQLLKAKEIKLNGSVLNIGNQSVKINTRVNPTQISSKTITSR